MSQSQDNPPLDLDHLHRTSEGDLGFVRELLTIYLDDSDRRVRLLAGAVSSGQVEAIRLNAHQLKGSSGNVGARGLSELARALEACTTTGRLADAGPLFLELEREFARVRGAAERLIRG